jgi:glycosyltransferase involved in cell wall biosynthesis
MAAGRPVIAYAHGGALETVVEGISGTLFPEQTVESLCEALLGFDDHAYDPKIIRRHAQQFGDTVFREQMSAFVSRAWEEHRSWS